MKLGAMRDAAAATLDAVRRGWPLLAIGFVVDAAFIFIFLIALQSYLPEDLGKSDAIVGYTLATFGLAKLLSQLGSGFIADRLGTRRALVMGTGLLLCGYVAILLLAHGAAWLIVGCGGVVGLGSSVTWPALYSAGSARFGEGEKGRFTALLTLATGGALLVGAGGGAVLNRMASFDAAMIAPIAAAGFAFTLALFTRGGEAHVDAAMPTLREFRAIVASHQRAMFALVVVCNGAALGALTAVFGAYRRDVLGVSLAEQGLLLAPAAILGGLLVVPGGAFADRIGARRIMVPSYLLVGVGLLALSRFSDPVLVVVGAGLTGAAYGLAAPTIASTMMSLAGPASSRGGVIAWFMTVDGVGHAVGPAVAGALLGLFGVESVLMLAGGLYLVVAYVALTARVGARQPADARSVVAVEA
jgi:MFS family permease